MADILADMQQKRHPAATWTTNDTVLKAGEIGVESDTGKKKTGDGSTAWTSLPYDIAAYDAGDIENVPSGNLAATDVQGALDELQTDVDTRLDGSSTSRDLSDGDDVAVGDGTLAVDDLVVVKSINPLVVEGVSSGTYAPKPLVAYKTADETVNNSATLQDDNELSATVEANKVYRVKAHLFTSSDTAADIKIAWSAPSGAGGGWSINSVITTATGYWGDIKRQVRDWSDAGADGASGRGVGIQMQVTPEGILTVGATAGTLTMRWCQDTAHASDTVIHEGSVLLVEELAPLA